VTLCRRHAGVSLQNVTLDGWAAGDIGRLVALAGPRR
jgi:hypothetical protein